jgi:hypothetical protein
VSANAAAAGETVIEGHVTRAGEAVPVGYARLLNHDGEFVAEVPLGDDGGFRFFAAPGSWTVRVLAPGGASGGETVSADRGQVTTLDVAV